MPDEDDPPRPVGRCHRALTHRGGDGAAGGASREEAPAEEGALEGPVPVHPAAAESGRLPRRIQPGDRFTIDPEHAAGEVGLKASQGLSGDDGEADGDERAVRRVQELVRCRRPDQPVAAVPAGAVDRRDLRVLGECIVELAVASYIRF